MSKLVAIGIATLGLTLAACESESARMASAQTCWIMNSKNALIPLDYGVQNLETCGARLEVRHLVLKRPVAGAYGGVNIFVDDRAITAAAPNGPEALLFNDADRKKIQVAIHRLLEVQKPSGS